MKNKHANARYTVMIEIPKGSRSKDDSIMTIVKKRN